MAVRIHPTAEVSDKIKDGEGSSIWHHAQVRENVSIGENCVIGGGKRFHRQWLRGDLQGGISLGAAPVPKSGGRRRKSHPLGFGSCNFFLSIAYV